MSHEVIWTRRALRRLDEIGTYIAYENPAAAAKVVERLIAATENWRIIPNPDAPDGSTIHANLSSQTSLTSSHNRVIDDRVHIITVLRAAQKWPFKR